MPTTAPTLEGVIAFVRRQSGVGEDEPITALTRLEADLGVFGDDRVDLLVAAEERFCVTFADVNGSILPAFDLKEDEYLFSAEGMDWPLGPLFRWLFNKPTSVVRDLTVGELHQVLGLLAAAEAEG